MKENDEDSMDDVDGLKQQVDSKDCILNAYWNEQFVICKEDDEGRRVSNGDKVINTNQHRLVVWRHVCIQVGIDSGKNQVCWYRCRVDTGRPAGTPPRLHTYTHTLFIYLFKI